MPNNDIYLVDKVSSATALISTHDELEELIKEHVRGVTDAHLDLRALLDAGRPAPSGVDGTKGTRRRRRMRPLATVFGSVTASREPLWARGAARGLRPLDAELNLPSELYSLGLRRLVVDLVIAQSFDTSAEKIRARTGTRIAKRQVEELTVGAALDFDAFYEQRHELMIDAPVSSRELLVLSTDSKGVVMRRDGLRAAIRKKTEVESSKLTTRLSPGEEPNRKRMAEVAAVYDL